MSSWARSYPEKGADTMYSQEDLNAIVAKTMTNICKDAFTEIGKKGSDVFQSFQQSFGTAFHAYLDFAVERYSTVKTLLYKDQPISLYDFFINPVLKIADKPIKTNSFEDISSVGRYIIITGTAGCGKSTLMKHFFLDSLKLGEYIPIMFELRIMNKNENTLLKTIYDIFVLHKYPLDMDHFVSSLNSGKYILFLDGLDELEKDIKDDVVRQILDLADEFNTCQFVISSRPDTFISWEKFTELKVCPLEKGQALDLIAKAKYDEATKEKFLEELDNKYYDELTSFASNPLLLTLMLLTYRDNAGLAKRKTSFYEEAFNALYNRHDATKAVYRRSFYSKLSKEEFITVLSCFCIETYFAGIFSFSQQSLLEHLASSRELSGLYYDTQDCFNDLVQSVCMIVPDGLEFIFTHRSFQEYFTALYISRKSDDDQKSLSYYIEKQLSPSNAAELYSLLYDLSKERFELNYAIPLLEKIFSLTGYGKGTIENSIIKYAQLLFSKVWIVGEGGKGENYNFVVRLFLNDDFNIFGMIRCLLAHRKDYGVERTSDRKQYSLSNDERASVFNVAVKKYGPQVPINDFINDSDFNGLGTQQILHSLNDEYCTLLEIYDAIKKSGELTQSNLRNILKNL